MKFAKLAVGLLLSTCIFCGCAKDSDVVLKINDKTITRAEFNSEFNKVKDAQLKGAPKEYSQEGSYTYLLIKDKYIQNLIARELLIQEFEKRKIEVTDNEIEAKRKEFIKQVGSEETFNNILKENGVTEEQLKNDILQEVKAEKLFKTLGSTTVSDKEALKYYNENKAQFMAPERVRSSHILIDANPETIKRLIVDSDKEGKLSATEIDAKVKAEVERKKALIEDLRKKAIANPKGFAKLAKEYSEDKGSALQGGDIGFVTKEQVVPEYSQAIFSTKVGTVCPLATSQFGTHIILVTDKAKAGTQSFASVKADLKAYLSTIKKSQMINNYATGLKNNAKIEYVDQELSPETLKKALEKALPKQLKAQENSRIPKSKQEKEDK